MLALWLSRDVVYHPRGYYRLACSLAKRFPVVVWGQPMPPVELEGPLVPEVEPSVWSQLTAPPEGGPPVSTAPSPPEAPYVIACNPTDLLRALRYGKRILVWDVWEDYAANFRFDPAYRGAKRIARRLAWLTLRPLQAQVPQYWLAEYTYAGLAPLRHSRFFPNAFVPVENAPPLLPKLVGKYFLHTGNLTESWGVFAALERALEAPTTPFILAGSVKCPRTEARIRSSLRKHQAWLWIRSRFVPYPIIQNLQRHARGLYALYQPLPHLREKLPGKFYEAAAWGIPCLYPRGVSLHWEAFWRWPGGAAQLFWSHYEPLLWAEVEALLKRL